MRYKSILSLLLFFLIPFFQLSAQDITITQSTDPKTIVNNNSVSCIRWLGHSPSSYYRNFNLSSYGINNLFNVSSVQIGIETAVSFWGDSQPITCKLYAGAAGFPTGFPESYTLIGNKEVNIPNQSLTLYTFDVTGIVPAGESLVIEIFLPNGDISDTVQNRFIIGSNSTGQSAPNYFRASDPGCGGTNVPIDVSSYMHLVMSVTGNEVVSEVNDEILTPFKFELLQNYPNPFNPSTTIQFQVPNSSFVNLKVYDVLGNEVVTLVNEGKTTGSYEVNFDIKGLSSGIYFYTINAGSFVETKKMILLK